MFAFLTAAIKEGLENPEYIMEYLNNILISETNKPDWLRTGLSNGLEGKDKMILSLLFDCAYDLNMPELKSNNSVAIEISTLIYPLIRRLYSSHFIGSYKEFIKYNDSLKKEIDVDVVIDYNKVCSKYVSSLYVEFKDFYIGTDCFKDFKIEVNDNVNDYEVEGLMVFCEYHVIPNNIWS